MTGVANTDKLVFICGSALRGQPDHGNLQDARFIREAKTAPCYRLHSVQDGWHPGNLRGRSGFREWYRDSRRTICLDGRAI